MDEWIIEPDDDNEDSVWSIMHTSHINADTDTDKYVRVSADVYVRREDYEVQVERLARLLNRVAPDGVLPDDEAQS